MVRIPMTMILGERKAAAVVNEALDRQGGPQEHLATWWDLADVEWKDSRGGVVPSLVASAAVMRGIDPAALVGDARGWWAVEWRGGPLAILPDGRVKS